MTYIRTVKTNREHLIQNRKPSSVWHTLPSVFEQPLTDFNSVRITSAGDEDNGNYIVLQVSFWLDEDTSSPKYTICVTAPFGWSPRIYGAVLSESIRKYNTVICHQHLICDYKRATINTVHSLFDRSIHELIEYLQ